MMACRLVATKPLSEPMVEYCYFDSKLFSKQLCDAGDDAIIDRQLWLKFMKSDI